MSDRWTERKDWNREGWVSKTNTKRKRNKTRYFWQNKQEISQTMIKIENFRKNARIYLFWVRLLTQKPFYFYHTCQIRKDQTSQLSLQGTDKKVIISFESTTKTFYLENKLQYPFEWIYLFVFYLKPPFSHPNQHLLYKF